MKQFDPNVTSFGRHETFPLRFSWPIKGYRYWCESNDVFSEEDAPVKLGVGKNMVTAIRYWLIASQLMNDPRDDGLSQSALGKALLSSENGWDPYLEDDSSIWLIHWLISSNPSQATSFYWFFNKFHKPEFTSSEVIGALGDFVKENTSSKVAPATMKHDITVLLRMYAPPESERNTPLEEGLDSPMTGLGLLGKTADDKCFVSKLDARANLPFGAFAYSVLDCLEARNTNNIALESLLRSDGGFSSPGAVFRLSEDGLLTKLEELIRYVPGYFELRETAGIRQFYRLKELNKIQFLDEYYRMFLEERAA
jgi:hypothetical protein